MIGIDLLSLMLNSEIHLGARENQAATLVLLPDNSAQYSCADDGDMHWDEGGFKFGYNYAICDAIIQF